MHQPCRSSARNHHPGRAGGLKDDQVLIRAWVFEVWPGWMPQPCRSSCRNHHPARARGDKDYEVLRVGVFESMAWLDAPAVSFFLPDPPSCKGSGS